MNLIIDAKSINPYNNCNLRKIIYHQYLPMLIGIFNQMGARFDRLRCEVCQNLILSPMNTGLLRYAVATALTVHGIETFVDHRILCRFDWLQQHLPFTVLKLKGKGLNFDGDYRVATALTVHGIETFMLYLPWITQVNKVATALTVHGIETAVFYAGSKVGRSVCCSRT